MCFYVCYYFNALHAKKYFLKIIKIDFIDFIGILIFFDSIKSLFIMELSNLDAYLFSFSEKRYESTIR